MAPMKEVLYTRNTFSLAGLKSHQADSIEIVNSWWPRLFMLVSLFKKKKKKHTAEDPWHCSSYTPWAHRYIPCKKLPPALVRGLWEAHAKLRVLLGGLWEDEPFPWTCCYSVSAPSWSPELGRKNRNQSIYCFNPSPPGEKILPVVWGEIWAKAKGM